MGRVDRPSFTVEVSGSGPDVLLIPGLSTPAAVWDGTVAALLPGLRVHAVQLKGFADGDPGPNAAGPVLEPFVDDLARYIDECGIDHPSVVGHSMGGLSALMLGVRHPGLPGRIVVVDAAPFIGPLFNPPASDLDSIRPLAAQLQAGLEQMAKMPMPPLPTGPVVDPGEASQAGALSNNTEGRTRIAGWMRHVDRHVVGQVMHDVMLTDLRSQLGKIEVPVSLIYAQDDRQKSAAQAAANFLPQYAGAKDFTATAIPGSYHFVMLDQPAAFLEALHVAIDKSSAGD